MIFEIKYASKFEQDGLVHQMDTLEELLKFVNIRAPLIQSFSPGVSIRPTENPNVFEIIVYDNFQKQLEEEVKERMAKEEEINKNIENSNIIKLS